MDKPRIAIVNKEDEVIGYKDRGELTEEDIYRVSALWLTNSKSEILLAQRVSSKKHDPGRWGPAVAGTVEEGETYEGNIIKEAEEELGLKNIKPILVRKVSTFGIRGHHFFCQFYTLVYDKPAGEFQCAVDEVEAVRWITPAALKKEFGENPAMFTKSFSLCIELFIK